MRNDASPVVVSEDVYYYPMDTAPLGKKVIALNEGGVAVFAVLTRDTLGHYKGWHPMIKERKDAKPNAS